MYSYYPKERACTFIFFGKFSPKHTFVKAYMFMCCGKKNCPACSFNYCMFMMQLWCIIFGDTFTSIKGILCQKTVHLLLVLSNYNTNSTNTSFLGITSGQTYMFIWVKASLHVHLPHYFCYPYMFIWYTSDLHVWNFSKMMEPYTFIQPTPSFG